MKNFFDELKRRKVFRVATVYLIATWLLIQVADTLFPILNLPDWSVRLITVFLLIGFPIAVILAWAFEMTPDGIKRAEDVDPNQPDVNGRKTDFIIIAILIVVIVIAGVERFFFADTEDQAVTEATEVSQPETATDISADSIAVLPFVNMSADRENEYFSDGLSEELLNVLARVDGLRVTSRTSAFAFKGQQLDIQTIADRLKVRHILEGSVRKSGNNVRITAQLIDTQTDTHLWSDTYDRKLENIFEIQDEISQNIVGELMSVLGRDISAVTVKVQAPTDNLEAYEEYLQGRHLYLQRRAQTLLDAVDRLKHAVQLDPDFARAWSQLASVYGVIASYTPAYDQKQAFELARQAAERALALDPNSAEAYSVLGLIAAGRESYAKIERLFLKAIELSPNDHQPRLWLGIHYITYGHSKRARKAFEEAYRLDPAVGIVNGWLGVVYEATGETEKALAAHQRAAEIGYGLGFIYLLRLALQAGDLGRIESLQQALNAINSTPFPGWAMELYEAEIAGRATPQLLEKMADYKKGLKNRHGIWWNDYAFLNEIDLAMDEVEESMLLESANAATLFLWVSVYEQLAEHPRLLQILEPLGYVDEWEKHGYPDYCQRVDDHLECDFP